ncbi:MAG: insulinase family protein [Candidatus Eisenbacteria sp.]|nr:insulinase family protein [Candidatus Eisenbacteria bacterium]
MKSQAAPGVLMILMLGMLTFPVPDALGGRPMPEILLPSPDCPLVDFRIEFNVGSIHERGGKEGLNYLTARTVAGGGTVALTYPEVLDKLYPMAAGLDVQPGKEVTVFIATVHRDHLYEFWRLFSDLLLGPRFDEADLARNRDLQLNYLRNVLRATADEDLGKAGLEEFIYQNHPYRHTVEGTLKAVESFTLEDVKEFYRKHYTRGNVIIGLAGGYPEDFPALVRSTLARLPRGRVRSIALPHTRPIQGIQVRLIEKPTSATAISIGFPIKINRSQEDFPALFFANSYLGEHRTFKGQLMRHLRGDRGFNYGDYSYAEYFEEEPGTVYPLTNIPRRDQYFSIWLRPVAHRDAHFCLRAAIRKLEQLVDDGMTEEEFEQTRGFLLGYTKLWGQSMSRRLGYAMDADFYGLDRDYLGWLDSGIRNLNVHKVNLAVRKYLQADHLKVVMVTEDAEAVKKALVSDAPSPVAYDVPKPDEILEEDREIEKYSLKITEKNVEIVSARRMFEE